MFLKQSDNPARLIACSVISVGRSHRPQINQMLRTNGYLLFLKCVFVHIWHKYCTEWNYISYIYNSPFAKSRPLYLLLLCKSYPISGVIVWKRQTELGREACIKHLQWRKPYKVHVTYRQQAASAGSLVLPVSDKNKTKECNTDCLAWLNKLFE